MAGKYNLDCQPYNLGEEKCSVISQLRANLGKDDSTFAPVKANNVSANFKGYYWEMQCRKWILELPHILYESNPTEYHVWKHEHNKNPYDGVVTLPDDSIIHLEMKYRNVERVYHSWVVKDWLPREADIIVTNNPSVISYKDKRLFDKQGKKLMTSSELIVQLGRLIRNILYRSKYLYLNRTFFSLIDVIKILLPKFNEEIKFLRIKTKSTEAFSSLKEPILYRLHVNLHSEEITKGFDRLRNKFKRLKSVYSKRITAKQKNYDSLQRKITRYYNPPILTNNRFCSEFYTRLRVLSRRVAHRYQRLVGSLFQRVEGSISLLCSPLFIMHYAGAGSRVYRIITQLMHKTLFYAQCLRYEHSSFR